MYYYYNYYCIILFIFINFLKLHCIVLYYIYLFIIYYICLFIISLFLKFIDYIISFYCNVLYYSSLLCITIINPRRACAARVTVLGLSFCLSVCHAILAVRATKSVTKDTIVLSVRFAAILK